MKAIIPEFSEVMDVYQAATYMRIVPDTLYKYALARTIPAFKFGNRWRFKKSLLDQWMDEQANKNVLKQPEPQ